jgi:predicted kinase
MPQLVFLQGYPGSGKTTLSRLLAERLGWNHIDRDQLGTSDIEDDAQERAEAYRRLRAKLNKTIAEGRNAIVDAPYLYELADGSFVEEALQYRVPYLAVWVTADRQERIRRRTLRQAPWDLVDLEAAVEEEEREYGPPPGWRVLHTDQMSTEEAVDLLAVMVGENN